MTLRFAVYLALYLAGFVFVAEPQTKTGKAGPSAKAQVDTKAEMPTAQVGFAVAPMVLKDEGCARDYVRAFLTEGVELRKKLADLKLYGCVDTTATAVFAGLSVERKDLAVDKDHVAYFRLVHMNFDADRTRAAIRGKGLLTPPGKTNYFGWIPDNDFYAVSPETFDQLLAENKIPISN